MMNKMRRVVSFLVLTAMICTLCGCAAGGSDTAANTGKTYNIAYQCAWGGGPGPFEYAEDLSETIVATSGGSITMDCLAVNSIVSSGDMLQSVSDGVIDAIHITANLFSDSRLGILSCLPVGMTWDQYMGWYMGGEGQQILDEVMAEFAPNVVAFPCGVVDSEIMYHSIKPIAKLDDIKGLKVRGVAEWAEIQNRLGASVVNIAGGDCYEGLSRGTIDACEYSSPATNWAAGFHEVAPYLTVPGIHNSCAVYLFIMNKDVWNGLDATTQEIIKTSCMASMGSVAAKDKAANAAAWNNYVELEAAGKLTIYRMPDEDLQTIRDTAAEYYAEKCESDALFAKVYNSQMAYVESVASWNAAAATN